MLRLHQLVLVVPWRMGTSNIHLNLTLRVTSTLIRLEGTYIHVYILFILLKHDLALDNTVAFMWLNMVNLLRE